MILYFLFYYTA